MLTCQYCNKTFVKRAHKNHESRCPKNANRIYKNGMTGKSGDLYPRKNYKPWNTGLSLKEIKKHYSIKSWNAFTFKNKTHTEETKNLLSIEACKRISKHSKYSKNVEYKPGIILESSFEVRTAEILDELKIKWDKVRQGYIWDDNGQQRRYIPDFYLPEFDIFLDPKNDYLIKKDKIKIESAMQINNIKVFVLSKKQITKEFITKLVGSTGVRARLINLRDG